MATIAVFNQKGGVGKTTTALNLLAAVAQRGERPWGVDLDPQAHLSEVFGTRAVKAEESVYAFLAHGVPLADIASITRSGVVVCPGHRDLAGLSAVIGKGTEAIIRLRAGLRRRDAVTGPVVIDCPLLLDTPALNALFAAHLVLVPIASDYLSLKAALETERTLNVLEPVLRRRVARRYLITRYDPHLPMSLEIEARVGDSFRHEDICLTRIREDQKVAESPSVGLDVFRHALDSSGADDYSALCDELTDAGFMSS